MKQNYKASVTFESMTQAPETVQVAASATSVVPATSRMIRAALKAKPSKNHWTSIVILVERAENVTSD